MFNIDNNKHFSINDEQLPEEQDANERLIDSIHNKTIDYFKYFKAIILFISSFGILTFLIISLYNSVKQVSPQYSSLFLTSIATFALYLAKTVIMTIWNYFIIRNFFTRVIINKDLPNSSLMIPWILSKIINKNELNDIKCNIKKISHNNIKLNYVPNKGWYTYIHTYNGKKYKLYINYRLGDLKNEGKDNILVRPDELVIYVRDLDINIITDFIKYCHKTYYSHTNFLSIWNYNNEWIEERRVNNLSVRDYYFKDELLEKIKANIEIYLGYNDSNWRANKLTLSGLTDSMIDRFDSKGYLLIGPPGTGKTKFVESIAYHLNMNIGLFDVTNPNFTNDDLINALKNVPLNTIFLLEHIDYLNDNIQLSCLYNIISGLIKNNNVIIFATANNISNMDINILRTGRIGHKIEFNYTNENERYKIFKYWFEIIEDNLINELNEIILKFEKKKKRGVSHAFLDNFCKECKCLDISIYDINKYLDNYLNNSFV